MVRPRFAVLVLVLLGIPLPAQEPRSVPAPARPSAGQAWQRLKDGNARFVTDRPLARKYAERRTETAKGQKPFAAILACADSRTGPEQVFDQGLGDLFVVRVAGNVTDPVVLGSVEYAVDQLHVPLIVVLGHEKCGAVAAALGGGRPAGNIAALIERIHVGKDLPKDRKAALAQAVHANTLYQAAALTKQSKLLRDMAASGRVRIVTAIYDLETGRVRWLDTPARKAQPAHSSP